MRKKKGSGLAHLFGDFVGKVHCLLLNAFPEVESHEATHLHVLAELGHLLLQDLAHGLLRVDDVSLLEQRLLLHELGHAASTIWARMFSGLLCRSSLPISISRSFAKNSGSASSTLTYSTFGLAAICMAKLSTISLNSGLRATKSVSQLSSSRTPMRLPAWM